MCHGKPGQIFAVNDWYRESACVFDITQIPFRVIHFAIMFGITADCMCYYGMPSMSYTWESPEPFRYTPHPKGGLAVADKNQVRWGPDITKTQSTRSVQLVGQPSGICSDNRGHLFVAIDFMGDSTLPIPSSRILVFAADTGELLQEIEYDRVILIRNIFWCEKMKCLIVAHNFDKISYIKIKCDF